MLTADWRGMSKTSEMILINENRLENGAKRVQKWNQGKQFFKQVAHHLAVWEVHSHCKDPFSTKIPISCLELPDLNDSPSCAPYCWAPNYHTDEQSKFQVHGNTVGVLLVMWIIKFIFCNNLAIMMLWVDFDWEMMNCFHIVMFYFWVFFLDLEKVRV